MSRKRNRSVRTLPLNTTLPQFPAPGRSPVSVISHKEYNLDKNCFGEPVKKSPSAYALYYEQLYSKKSDNVDNILTGVRNLSFKSSSSSLSWSDEYESESCQKMQDELEKIENVLCGIESVTEPYDEAEIKEWMEMFPNLRIFGRQPHKSSLSSAHQEKQRISYPNSEDCDEETTSRSDTSDNNILKSTVIDTLYDSIIQRLTKRESHKPEIKVHKSKLNKPKNRYVNKTKNPLTTIEIDHYLKVSPIPQRKNHGSKCWDDHKNAAFFVNSSDMASANLVNSDMSSAKWLKSDSPEYNSLPFLMEELRVKGIQSGGDAHRKKNKQSVSKTKSRNSFVLPPIESPRMFSDHFRSVSAIPMKQNNKCLSAFSMKLDKELCENKLDFSKYLKMNTSVKITRSRIPRIYKKWDSIDN